jgi:AcrR family transcriptional regulator
MPEDVRQEILAAARHLFAYRGFGSTSVRSVVERAGVTKPTLYYYFENKEALYLECVQSTFAELVPLVEAALTGPGDIRERLQRFTHDYVQKGLEDLDGVRLALTATNPGIEKRPEIDLMSFHTKYFGPLEALFAEGIETGVFRTDIDPGIAVVGLIGPISMHLRGAIEGLPLPEDYAVRIVDIYLNGVSPQ